MPVLAVALVLMFDARGAAISVPATGRDHGGMGSPADVTDEALVGAGLVDEARPDATRRKQALRLLLDRGATLEDLVAHRDDLGVLASRLANGARPTMTPRELARRAGVPLEFVDRVSSATGLPGGGPDTLSATDDDVRVLEIFAAGVSVFGEEVAFQLARVLGASTAKIADALVSAFIAAVGSRMVQEDPSGLSLVEANFQLSDLMPQLMGAVEQLLRRHLVNLARSQTVGGELGYETRQLAVGFVDLVGSTMLSARLTTAELSDAMTRFESTAMDIVVGHRGRVVKMIGDEVMFVIEDPRVALEAVTDLVEAFRDDSVLPPLRAGVSYGSVLSKDGDCFGPVVNLAARLASVARANEVLVDEPLGQHALDSGWSLEPVSDQLLKGFDPTVKVNRLTRWESGELKLRL